jgi:hypothetical protein
MIGNVVEWVYKTWVLPRLEEYVNKTDNTWDNTVLAFIDEVMEIIIEKLNSPEEVIKEISIKMSKDLQQYKK